MSRPVIAVDIDDVLASSAPTFIEFSNKRWGYNHTLEDYDEHLAEMWEVDLPTVDTRIKEYHRSGTSAAYSTHADAFDVLSLLAPQFKLVITTSRRKELQELTHQWLQRYYPDLFHDVHFAGIWDSDHPNRMNHTKAGLCQEIGAQFLIDDQPKHCIAAADAGITALLFGDYPWSRSIHPTKNMHKVSDWEAVKVYFGV